jgi:fructokinase
MALYGGLEAGGTKFVCAVGTGPDDLSELARFPTTSPEETMAAVVDWFAEQHARTPLAALGVSSFGPLEPNPAAPLYGFITTTPKPGWHNADIVGPLRHALGVPVGFDTDVNGAALGEHRWGAAQGLDTFAYLTVGTGLGGGGMVGGKLIHGLLHPEMGHMLLRRDPERDPYGGYCVYHGDCFEGLVCGPAIADRWGKPAHDLPDDHPAWELEADYLAQGLVNIILILSPQRLILGGGVMEQSHLFPRIRRRVQEQLNGYIQKPAILEHIDEYIVPPGLGSRAGVLGAIALAQLAERDPMLGGRP